MAEEKKVLIITYYWPPSGGSGVQRWLKFVKYLPQFGYTPYVFTPENPSFNLKDESLLRDVPNEAEVIRFPIWEPYEAFFKFAGMFGAGSKNAGATMVSNGKRSVFQKVSTWLRGNLLIPDPRVFWVRPSASFLHDFIRDNSIRTIITTGPPHSIHLIGYKLKKKNPSLKWMADFRDPWSEWGFLDSLGAGKAARYFHRKMEHKVLTSADEILTITPFYVRQFESLSGRKVRLFTNGFDEDDFSGLNIRSTGKFMIRHVGIVNEKCNPRPVMLALKSLVLAKPELRQVVQLDFIGEVHPDFMKFVNEDNELRSFTNFIPPVPHKKLIDFYNESSLLLLVLTGYRDAEGYMPGKLFEYIATGLPVLGVGPEGGDAAQLLKKSRAGRMIDGSNSNEIKAFVYQKYFEWQSSTLSTKVEKTSGFSRREITGKLVELIES